MKTRWNTRLGLVAAAVSLLLLVGWPVLGNDADGRLLVLPDAGSRSAEDWLVKAIDGASRTVRLTIYQIESPAILDALVRAHRNGVDVRVLYNSRSFNLPGFPDPNVRTIPELRAAGVSVQPSSKKFMFTHQKTLTIDQAFAVVMTFNLAKEHFAGCRDFGVVTTDPGQIAEITEVFEADWNGRPAPLSLETLVWSPDHARQRLIALIDGSRQTLEVYSQTIRDQAFVKAMMAAAARGVQVRLISAAFGNTERPPEPKVEAVRQTLEAHGVQTRGLKGLYAHAKVIITDSGTPSGRAFVGSQNFSSTSMSRNRELGIIVTYVPLLAALRDQFDQDWGH